MNPTTPNEVAAAIAAAMRTMTVLGYTYHGGEYWKPPIGPRIESALTKAEAVAWIDKGGGIAVVGTHAEAWRALPDGVHDLYAHAVPVESLGRDAPDLAQWSHDMAEKEAGQYTGAGAHGLEDEPAGVPDGWYRYNKARPLWKDTTFGTWLDPAVYGPPVTQQGYSLEIAPTNQEGAAA